MNNLCVYTARDWETIQVLSPSRFFIFTKFFRFWVSIFLLFRKTKSVSKGIWQGGETNFFSHTNRGGKRATFRCWIRRGFVYRKITLKTRFLGVKHTQGGREGEKSVLKQGDNRDRIWEKKISLLILVAQLNLGVGQGATSKVVSYKFYLWPVISIIWWVLTCFVLYYLKKPSFSPAWLFFSPWYDFNSFSRFENVGNGIQNLAWRIERKSFLGNGKFMGISCFVDTKREFVYKVIQQDCWIHKVFS